MKPQHVIDGFEDVLYYAWKERRLPANVTLEIRSLENAQDRARTREVFEQGITSPVGCALADSPRLVGRSAVLGKRRVGCPQR